jgi:hypothetical protein
MAYSTKISAMFRYVCFGVSVSYTTDIKQFIHENIPPPKSHGRMSNIHKSRRHHEVNNGTQLRHLWLCTCSTCLFITTLHTQLCERYSHGTCKPNCIFLINVKTCMFHIALNFYSDLNARDVGSRKNRRIASNP